MDAFAVRLPSGRVEIEADGERFELTPELVRALLSDTRLIEELRRASRPLEDKDARHSD